MEIAQITPANQNKRKGQLWLLVKVCVYHLKTPTINKLFNTE